MKKITINTHILQQLTDRCSIELERSRSKIINEDQLTKIEIYKRTKDILSKIESGEISGKEAELIYNILSVGFYE